MVLDHGNLCLYPEECRVIRGGYEINLSPPRNTGFSSYSWRILDASGAQIKWMEEVSGFGNHGDS